MGRPLPSASEPCRRHRPPGRQPEFPQPRFAGRCFPRHRQPDPFHPLFRRCRRLRGHPQAGRLRQRCHPWKYHGPPFHDRPDRCHPLLFRRQRSALLLQRRFPFHRIDGEPFFRFRQPFLRLFRQPLLRDRREQKLLFPQQQFGELSSVHFLLQEQRLLFRKHRTQFQPLFLFGRLPQQRRLFGEFLFPQ